MADSTKTRDTASPGNADDLEKADLGTVYAKLGTSVKGLTSDEAKERLGKYGRNELVVFTFHAELGDDRGRRINNALDGWQDTLVGKPRSIYDAWEKYLKPEGYQLHARVVGYTKDIPSEFGLVVVWAKKDE